MGTFIVSIIENLHTHGHRSDDGQIVRHHMLVPISDRINGGIRERQIVAHVSAPKSLVHRGCLCRSYSRLWV